MFGFGYYAATSPSAFAPSLTLTPSLYLSFPSSPPQGQGWRKEGTKRHQGCTHHRVHHQHAQAYQGHVSYFARPSCTVCLKTLLRFCTCEGGLGEILYHFFPVLFSLSASVALCRGMALSCALHVLAAFYKTSSPFFFYCPNTDGCITNHA